MRNSKDSPSVLGKSPIIKLLLQYSIPAIIAMTATSLYNIVDSIFIGRGVGAMAIAGLAITFPLMNLIVAFGTLIAAGGATICSIFLGQKDEKKANETLLNVTWLCIAHGIIFGSLSLIFLRPLLVFFGATDGTIEYAADFMFIILLGTPITYIYFGLNNLIRASGYPKKAMLSALLSVLSNVILAPIFIFYFELGIKGAAMATMISQCVALVWVVSHFFLHTSYVRYKKGYSWVNIHIISKLYSIGLSPFIMNICACLIVILINKSLLDYGGNQGELGVGSYGIINRVAMLFVMVVFGITQGMQPVLGYNYGASNWNRVKKTLKYGLIGGATITTFGWIICEMVPSSISSLFTTDQVLIDITNRGFRLSFIFWPLIGIQIVIQNFFQSIGKPKFSIFLSLTRQMIFLLPLLLVLPSYWGMDGIWLSMSISDCIACLLAIITLIYQLKRLNVKFSLLESKTD